MLKKDAIKKIEYYCELGKNVICPFSNEKCLKVPRSEIGVCSFIHQNREQIICPNAFLKIDYLSLIANKVLGTNSFSVIKEAKIKNNFIDFILVDDEFSENYCAVEVQALDTTGNYKWVLGEKVKPYCVNWKTTKKTIISQLLEKIPIFNANDKRLILVIQDTFFDYCGFPDNGYDDGKDFHVLTLKFFNDSFNGYAFRSYDFNDLLSLFKNDDKVDLNKYVKSYLKKRSKKKNLF